MTEAEAQMWFCRLWAESQSQAAEAIAAQVAAEIESIRRAFNLERTAKS